MKFGYQLSSITPYLKTEDDLWASLHKIAAIGYTEVQLQGVPYIIPDNAVVSALRESGLSCIAIPSSLMEASRPYSSYMKYRFTSSDSSGSSSSSTR